jgi:hypothetical protein
VSYFARLVHYFADGVFSSRRKFAADEFWVMVPKGELSSFVAAAVYVDCDTSVLRLTRVATKMQNWRNPSLRRVKQMVHRYRVGRRLDNDSQNDNSLSSLLDLVC